MRMARPLAGVLAAAALAACTSPARSAEAGSHATTAISASSPTPPTAPSTSTAPPPVAPTPPPSPLPRRFASAVSPIPPELAAQMRGTTWRPGCPVPLDALRLLTLRYWGFDGSVHEGPLVVNATVAEAIVEVFHALFRARFPIRTLHLAVRYRPGHDDPNDRRDYTASFNCRPVVTPAGPASNWSQHAYGLAVDINPLQNPYVASDGFVRNRFARPYRDRSQALPGMVHDGDVVVRSFDAIGWGWGGHWSSGKDYMHFSASGT